MSILSDKIEQIETLKSGMGQQYILDAANKILGNPILMCNMKYDLLSYSGETVTDDPIWNEMIMHGNLSYNMIEFLKNERFIDIIANMNAIAFMISDNIEHDRLLGKIYNKDNITVSYLMTVACNRLFESDDPVVFETVCNRISKEIKISGLYQDYGKTYMATLISELVDGSINDKELYASHVANIYDGLQSYLYVGIADITQCDPKHAKLAYYRDLFKRIQPIFKYSIYSNHIIMIISSDDMELNIKKDLHKLHRLFKQKNIYVGISKCFENIYELHEYYMQAVDALNDGVKYDDNQWIFLYEEAQ